jgi:type 1 glutamine amidotransferase
VPYKIILAARIARDGPGFYNLPRPTPYPKYRNTRSFLMRWLLGLTAFALLVPTTATPKPVVKEKAPKGKRLLLVTHSGGFIHDSVAVAEKVLKEIGPKNGFEVTCYRFTGDPDAKVQVKVRRGGREEVRETTALEAYSDRFRKATGEGVTREQCGHVNAETLKNFDAVLFFTTGSSRDKNPPVTKDELKDLITWVENGGAFAGTHCATDTLYGTPYGKLVGAFFAGHPWHQKIKLHCLDPKHPAAQGLKEGSEITDEMYQFADAPYSRKELHIIFTIDNSSIDTSKGRRKDKDYAVSWCQKIGKGRSFYTSLGHRKEVWKDPRYQKHLLGGLKWAVGLAEGDATPTAKLAKSSNE